MSEHKSFDLSDLKILIVEDSKHMQLLFREIMRTFNVDNFRCADDGADAFMVMKEFQPDIITTGWMMNPVDGIDFVKMLRADMDHPSTMTPVIMITAHAELRRVVEARDAGINEILVKPISPHSLYSRFIEIIERPRKFVRNRDRYIGPDRRRGNIKIIPYEGPERRAGMADGWNEQDGNAAAGC